MNKQDEIENLKKLLADKEVIIKGQDNRIQDQDNRIQDQDNRIQDQDNRIQAKKIKITELEDRIKQLLQKIYGKKSEKLKPTEELPVFDEANLTPEEQAAAEAAEAELTVASYKRKRPSRAGIPIERKLPEDLPRIKQEYDLPEEEKICTCGGNMHCIGEECSEQLEIIPAKIQVIVTARKKYACRACTDGVKIATPPPVLLPKSIATPGLLAHVVIAKYEDHLPLYRQEQMWKRLGIDLTRSTLCNWVLKAAERVEALIPVLEEKILSSGYVQVDETPVQVMEANKVRLSKKTYMWAIYTALYPGRGVVYKYTMDRTANHPNDFFKDYTGYLQSDAYSGYNETKKKKGIKGLACWAHARRKFVDIVKISTKAGTAHEAVATIAKLYKIETEIPVGSTPEQIVVIRQTKAQPILEKFYSWLQEKKKKTLPKGPLGRAINYLLDRWDEFIVYLEDGRLNIDNNGCENIIRPFTIGRKNWLFMGNERGGKAAAILYSLINTCRLNKINTHDYLTFLFTEFPKIDSTNKGELMKLLPQHYQENHKPL